jgi:hypothetical protein
MIGVQGSVALAFSVAGLRRASEGPVSEITIGREADPSQMGCQG